MQALARYSCYVGNLNGVCLHTGTFREFFHQHSYYQIRHKPNYKQESLTM